jgi:hypothetical protein
LVWATAVPAKNIPAAKRVVAENLEKKELPCTITSSANFCVAHNFATQTIVFIQTHFFEKSSAPVSL